MNKKIYVGMTADIMHPGLIHIIHEATKYGDVIVGLLTDKAIAEHKRLPYLTYDQRKEVVENIKGVCEVVPQEDWSYVPNLEKLKPDYIIHGDDWKTGPLREVREQVFEVMNAQGGKVIEIPYTRGINSSSLDKDIKAIGTTPDVRLKSLRRLIQAKPVVRILEAHDGLCGLIIEKFGIPFCHLGTNEREIPQEFLNSQKILITYVQKIFNGLSLFGIGGRSFHVGCIILDDSHACMDSILSSCTIRIEKKDSLYSTLLSLFVDDLKQQGEGTYQDILNGHDSDSHAIPYWAWHDKGEAVIQLLSTRTQDSSIKFAWPLIRDQIPLCRAYVSSNAIEISPECIPIKSFGIFHTASHRVLMSATTQEDTLFVKGLDLSISAIENPLIDSNYRCLAKR